MIQHLYLALCILGTALPCSQFLPFLFENGLDVSLLVEQLFANRISAFFGLDVVVSSLVLWTFVLTEGRRQQMSKLWIYIVCNLLVGVSLGLPLFLYMRERKIAHRLTSGEHDLGSVLPR
jgi:Terpene cyclase DEP1